MERKVKNIFVNGPIAAEKIAASIKNHSTKTNIGAHSIFLGQVRADEKSEGRVQAIEYTAYEEMTVEKAHELREIIFEKYPLTCMHIYHSLGRIEAGEICLFVFTSSKHRKAAIDACEELVERIKKELPIWGREIVSGDKSIWKDNN
jgi:molybdopterin synthase catalytic subunit